MSEKKILGLLFGFMLVVILIVMNNKLGVSRTFTVYEVKGTKACFLVDDAVQIEEKQDQFKYINGKNFGIITLHKRGISPDLHKTEINSLPAGYQKLRKKRIYEYMIAENLVLRDVFEYVNKSSVNLVPYKETCDKIKKKYTKHKTIF